MQTSLKRLGFQFSTRWDMSAKFPRGGGGANPFSAIRLHVLLIFYTEINQSIPLNFESVPYLLKLLKDFPFNFGQMLISVRQCTEPITQLPRLKVKVEFTLEFGVHSISL